MSRLATMTDAEFAAEMAKLDAAIARGRRINRKLKRMTADVQAGIAAMNAAWADPQKDAAA
jgi:hypothetical protein